MNCCEMSTGVRATPNICVAWRKMARESPWLVACPFSSHPWSVPHPERPHAHVCRLPALKSKIDQGDQGANLKDER